jgi:two-component system NtrC family sensor kinase
VTKSILTFGRQDSSENKEFLLGDVMRDAIEMVRKKLEIKSIDLRFGIEPETLTVSGDIVNLRQVFLNLLNNAVYALAEKYAGEHGGGRLVFRARPYGQGWVVIEVTDNGPGIPKEVLANIYTPFFTTKPPQKGRGLGLAVCYGLIESMGGSIEVETWQGEGTVFRITLPAS